MSNINAYFLKVFISIILIVVFMNISSDKPFADETIIQKAEQLAKNGDYVAAWRLLYGRTSYSDEGRQVARALDQLEWDLLHDDRSEFMLMLRNSDVPIIERDQIISDLVHAIENRLSVHHPLLLNPDDPFVQFVSTPKIPTGEKIYRILRIKALVKKHYTNTVDHENVRQQIQTLTAVAAEHLQQGQYDMVFSTLREAGELAEKLHGVENGHLLLLEEAVELYFQHDMTPLTQLLSDPDVSFLDKRRVVIELNDLIYHPNQFQEIVIREQRYTGSFIDLLRDFKNTKMSATIWVHLRSLIEKENIYHGAEISPDLARSAFPDDEYQPVFPPKTSFESLQIRYHINGVFVSVQGTISEQNLQALYTSVGFTAKMFPSRLKYGDVDMLSQNWNVILRDDVQFARFNVKETKDKVWGSFVFAYQESESGGIQFYLHYYTT